MENFEAAISNLDLALFEKIPSQSTDDDKGSLLACQLSVRSLSPKFRYLEIGSYLGGSIQPYLLDPACEAICSIDKRPESQPDERGVDYVYENNSTARMLEKLRAVSSDIQKINVIDGDTRSIEPSEVEGQFNICFIDGEHTDEAVLSDFRFCLQVIEPNAVIVFHDAQITYNGIQDCLDHLDKAGHKFRAYALPNVVFVVEIGDFPLHKNPAIVERLVDNHRSFLFALQDNDHFRRFANRFPFGTLRRMMVKARGGARAG